jgi:sugar phosphate isomerase/epimerase
MLSRPGRAPWQEVHVPFELSCTDFTFHVLPHEEALGLIARLEIPYADLLFFPGCRHVQAEEVRADPATTAAKISARVSAAGLQVADVLGLFGGYRDLSPNDPSDEVRVQSRDAFERLLEFAHGAGAHGVTIIPGMDWPGETHESALARAADEMAWRAGRAAEANLRLSFEPHVESITETVEDTLRLCELAPGLRVALDYSHLVYHGIPPSEIERLHPVTGHIHGRQGKPGQLQSSAREGSIDFGRALGLFVEEGFDGFLCLEYCCDPYNDMDRVDTLTETIKLRDLFLRVRAGLPADDEMERFPWD